MPLPHGTGRAALAATLAAVCVTALVGCSSSSGGGKSAGSTRPSPGRASPSDGGQDQVTDEVTIDDFAFMPETLTVAPGARITVTNKDNSAHTVTATSGRAFDSGTVDAGRTVTFTAPAKAGVYPYICTIHPFMKGVLTVR
ncbi:cupredoxin domain-containing protein [Streptomyces lushanensis]|uniref:cupredoxin domain-containing protein n=1 Tax=Streptomyces lushanensis TaxID=1434255 RepID=UPI00099FBA4C|nr:cupredoxin domain-containing protein [Streptomyces lushanensis]